MEWIECSCVSKSMFVWWFRKHIFSVWNSGIPENLFFPPWFVEMMVHFKKNTLFPGSDLFFMYSLVSFLILICPLCWSIFLIWPDHFFNLREFFSVLGPIQAQAVLHKHSPVYVFVIVHVPSVTFCLVFSKASSNCSDRNSLALHKPLVVFIPGTHRIKALLQPYVPLHNFGPFLE